MIENKKNLCSSCGEEMDEPTGYKCEDCYYQEAKIFFWVVGGITLLLLILNLIKYLKGK